MEIKQIIETLGEEAMIRRLAVSKHAIDAARKRRYFPSLWYAELKTMGEERNFLVPMEAFNFKRQPRPARIRSIGK